MNLQPGMRVVPSEAGRDAGLVPGFGVVEMVSAAVGGSVKVRRDGQRRAGWWAQRLWERAPFAPLHPREEKK